jgi:ribosomal protein S18 acetylase RimI-like enzyme
MSYVNRMASILCACIGMMLFSNCIKKVNKTESNKKMNKSKNKQNTSSWLQHVNKITASRSSGQLMAEDKSGKSVILEWIKTDMLSADYSTAMKRAWDVACPTYMKVEMDFLRTHPEVVGHDTSFTALEPLFKNGIANVDWTIVEAKMQEHLRSIFLWDTSTCGDEMKKQLANVAHIFVEVKDKTSGKLLGFISFLVTPEYANQEIKCIAFAVKPEAQNRGLGRLLMSSIFRIIPQIQRIFLCTRVTNQTAQKAYYNWGFVNDNNPIIEEHHYTFNLDHWIFMEYKTDTTNLLQKTAYKFVDIK